MSESDVIINELKHINESLSDLKGNYEKFDGRFEKFENKFEKMETKFEATKEKVDEMRGERNLAKWGIPIIVSAAFAFISTKLKGG
jgi:predicted  nucleic acid-binding Zn-ribbon protein